MGFDCINFLIITFFFTMRRNDCADCNSLLEPLRSGSRRELQSAQF